VLAVAWHEGKQAAGALPLERTDAFMLGKFSAIAAACGNGVGLLLALAPIGWWAEAAPVADRPNVLFIAVDDLRNDLGCYGDDQVKSPHLDALAKRSRLFTRAYCQQAVCNPSRASLLTGLRPDHLRIWDLPTHLRSTTPTAVTLPQHFKNHGYFTQNIGKIFHNWRQKLHGDPDSWSVPAVMHYASHRADEPQVAEPIPLSLASDPRCECRDVEDDAYFDGRVAGLAIEALRERQQAGTPFFLAVGFWKPHAPFNAPKKYWDLYRREDIQPPSPEAWPKDAPTIAWHDSREILGEPPRPLSPEAILEMRHGYLANISYMDAQVGRVLKALDDLDLTRNTLVVFWSDHGYHLGEQTLWAKTSNFELDARVPLMIALPGSPQPGTATTALVELLDLYPTLSELCKLPIPAGLDGLSLVPVLEDPNRQVRSFAMTQHPRPAYYSRAETSVPEVMGYSIRTPEWRYTEWRDWKSGKTIAGELYDHRQEPHETQNFFDHADYRDAQTACQQLLQSAQPLVQPGWPGLVARP
jgi:iduronate 2-sulfatase